MDSILLELLPHRAISQRLGSRLAQPSAHDRDPSSSSTEAFPYPQMYPRQPAGAMNPMGLPVLGRRPSELVPSMPGPPQAAIGSGVTPSMGGLAPNAMDVDMNDLATLPIGDPGGAGGAGIGMDVKTFLAANLQDHSTVPSPDPSLISGMGAMPMNVGSGPGGGPMPPGFGMYTSNQTGSTLTEFTKRRNWSKLVLEELRDLMFVLSADGRIQHVSPSCKMLTGYEGYMMMGKFLGDLIHADDKGMFVREFNESIASGNQMRFFYRMKRQDGSYRIFEAFGHPHHSSEAFAFGRGGASFCRGYFLMSRPYPTKNASLLDSFLEHKIENERLLKRIAELKKEEKDEEHEQESLLRSQDQGSTTPADSMRTDALADAGIHDGMPPPARPLPPGNALTRQNLSEALASARPDSIGDKMARYEGATHLETIEMLTGLRYRDGERSQGISTGDTNPALIRGDAGIAILADRDSRVGGDRKKKTKVADEYVCTDCGTLDSPEWRKGPSGPKTLCNACGLRWAKKEKKRQQQQKGSGSGLPASLPMGQSTGSS